MNILCTICMRKGSTGIINKNYKVLNNKPLMQYTIDQALNVNLFKNIVVSTDSKKISNLSNKLGVESWFLRPKKFSSGKAPKIQAIKHAFFKAEKYYNSKFDIIVDLDVTSPLRKISDIKKSIKKFISTKSNNLITVCDAKKNPYFNMIEIINNKPKIIKKLSNEKKIYSRQAAPKVYEMNASIYIWSRNALINNLPIINNKTSVYFMPQIRSFDIDSKLDWKIVEFLIKK